MYPSSSSSSSQSSMGPTDSSGLIRYGSAPGSLLASAVDSVIGPNSEYSALGSQTQSLFGPTRYFSSETSSLTSDSTCEANNSRDPRESKRNSTGLQLQRSYGLNERAVGEYATGSNLKTTGGGSGSSSLVRHSSLPAGFLNHLAATTSDNGFSMTSGIGSYNSIGSSDSSRGISRLNSQLSFTRQESLSQITEENENAVDGMSTDNGRRKATHSYATASFRMGPWEDTNSIMFSPPPSKREKDITAGLVDDLNAIESQFQFSLPQTALEMSAVDQLLHIPQNSVPCKIRAKRGCATHPRSIAERERRTRISGKLQKLQELVPNMDKQTSYSDMLDLAVQHIKDLQNQVQKLNKENEKCTCGCK